MDTTSSTSKDDTFQQAVVSRFGIKPEHVVGLTPPRGWVVGDQVGVKCTECPATFYLVTHRGGLTRDGVAVCPECGWAVKVRDLSRADQRAIRAAAVEQLNLFAAPADEPPQVVTPPTEYPTANSQPMRNLIAQDGSVDTLEAQLRNELRGRRLVCEVPLDDGRREVINEAFKQLRNAGVADNSRLLTRRYPALTACFLVSAATHGYEAGNLYDHLPIVGLDGSTLGRAFERVLDELHLERFDAMVAEGALRYVARILGHAGIPAYCCDDYFGLIIDELHRGVDDATELLTRLRLAPSRLVNIDKPVGRFLLYGGEISRDFLDRSIEMVSDWAAGNLAPDPSRYGLASYVWEALGRFDRSYVNHSGGRRSSRAIPRPTVRIDPWDPTGPFVQLPAVPAGIGSGSWRISSSDRTFDVRTSNLEERHVALPRARSWNVDLLIGNEVARRSQFVGLAELNSLLFDPSGSLVRDPTRVSSRQVRLLYPNDATIVVECAGSDSEVARVIEEYPEPTGDWSGFRFVLLDLDGVRRLTIRRSGVERTCWISDPIRTPTVIGEPLHGVTSADGLPIYDHAPEIDLPREIDEALWQLSITVNDQVHQLVASDTVRAPSLEKYLPTGAIAEVDVVGRGPLGSDVRSRFVVIPELMIERPSRVVLPGSGRPSLRVTAASALSIGGQRAGEQLVREVREIGDRAAVEVSDGQRTVHLAISLPLLIWSFSSEDVAIDAEVHVSRIAAADVLDDPTPLVKVRCGRAGVHMSIDVASRGDRLYVSPEIITSAEGRWVFDLTPAKDALRASTAATTAIHLRVDGIPVLIGELRQDLGVEAVTVVHGEGHSIKVRWTESRAVNDRVVRLWPLSRPWLRVGVFEVPDGNPSELKIDTAGVEAGTHLIDIAIDDGWTTPRRPKLGSANTARAMLGNLSDDSEHVLDILAAALHHGRLGRKLTSSDIDDHADEMLAGLTSQLSLGTDPTTVNVFHQLCTHLASRPDALAASLDRAVGAGIEPDILLGLSIEMAPMMGQLSTAVATPALWAACPILAACLDLASENLDALRHLETYLGIAQPSTWTPDVTPVSDENMRVVLNLDPPQLRLIRAALDAVPLHLPDPDTRQTAAFEWVINHQSGLFDATEWVISNAPSLNALPLPEWAEPLVEPELLEPATTRAFPRARLPELVICAACLVLSSDDPAPRRALQELRAHAPLIVTRSLVMAILVEAQQRGRAWHN